MQDLLTTRQVQDMLRLDRTTIYRMIEAGRLPAVRAGKQWRFSRTEIERWLEAQAAGAPRSAPRTQSPTPDVAARNAPLADLLPMTCVQMIQDAFAEILGVMMVVTDMAGRPITRVSNPCGYYHTVIHESHALTHCIRDWQRMAADPAIEPRFIPSEIGLMCARALIRAGDTLKGMLMVGGVAPETWPPEPSQLAGIARAHGLEPGVLAPVITAVYHLEPPAQGRVLRSAQRIADVFSNIAADRSELRGRLSGFAALVAVPTEAILQGV